MCSNCKTPRKVTKNKGFFLERQFATMLSTMYVIEVIPLSKATGIESLSYYSAVSYPEGALISVPIRKKEVQAVVVTSEPVSAAKTAIRAATFSLKKLVPQEDIRTLPRSIIDTAKALTKTTPAHLGSILFALLPPDVRVGAQQYPYVPEYHNSEESTPSIFTGTQKDRFITYRSHIRQSFAHRGSVLFVVPTSAAVANAQAELEHGIEKRVVTFSSTHTKKQIESSYEKFNDLSSAKLIITTPNFAFLDRHDITTIIIEESGSPHYKTRTRPYLDARDALRTYAKVTSRSIMFGDMLPRSEEEILRREEIYTTHEEHPKRIGFDSAFTVSKHEKKPGEKDFAIFTPELIEGVETVLQNKGRVFLYAARKGIAPMITCYDCGYIFRCPESGAPYSLIQTGEGEQAKRWFIDTTSGKRISAADTCDQCGSWRLREQGIGIQQVLAHARKLFPTASITLFDHTTATTHVKAKKLAKQFYDNKSSILIGTSMALPYLTKPVTLTALTSYEAARVVPTWRAEEQLLSLLLKLRELTISDCYVLLRSDPDPLLKYAARGLIDDFYNEETAMRQALSYPPYTTFILLTWHGEKEQVTEIEEMITTQLPVDIHCYNEPLKTKKGFTRHGLIRIPRSEWPDPKLMDALRNLPPYVKIEVGPDRII